MADDERLRQAIRVGNIGIFDHDHETDEIYWSLELRRIYGWDDDEPATLGKIISHVHPADFGSVVAAVGKAHDPSGDGTFDIEHRINDRGNRLRWVQTRSHTEFRSDSNGARPVRTIGAVQDVTERRVAEERLRVLDTVLSSSTRAIAIADAAGKFTFANASLCRLWGYADGEVLLGRSLFEFWKVPDPEKALSDILRDRIQTVELTASRVDGTTFDLGITAEAVCDAKGALTQVLVSFRDDTYRKSLETQLLQAQKMESVGRLAGGVAHDFNNLLTVIGGGLEMAMAELPDGDLGREYLIGAAEAAQSAASLTRQLLAFSRKEIIAPKVLDLNQVIFRVEKMILRLIGEDIHLETLPGANLPPILFDPGQMEQIILNLAVNARDAMPGGGRLTIETSRIYLDDEYTQRHVDVRAGSYVLLSVSDNGSGLTADAHAHLFEPFFTTKGPGRGTGLGLAMVYGAVQQNNGRIEVTSELNQGTTFKIYLRATTETSPAPPDPEPVVNPLARRATVMVVEDDPGVRAFAADVITRAGHDVQSFPNAEAALAAVSSLRAVPELLVTDVVMPGVSGTQLAARISAILPGIRVLYVSGYTHDVMVNHGVKNDDIEFLAKPYSGEQLVRRIREVLDRADSGEVRVETFRTQP